MPLEDHEQLTLQEIGKEGCYLLCVKRIAEIETGGQRNPVEVYRYGVNMGWIRSDCLMLDAASVLSWLTGKKWTKVNLVLGAFIPVGTKYLIAEWVKKTPSSTLTHFVLMELDGKTIKYNPLLNDWLANGWSIVEYRAFVEDLEVASV